jgi:iron complex outermembrane receptor protein
VRATWAQVFRAPQITDRFSAPATSNPIFFDPCVGLTQAQVDANPNLGLACTNVAHDGSFPGAPTSQVQQTILSNPDLKPETGSVITGGVVFDPSFLKNFSVTIDGWHYKIKNAIIAPDVNTIAATCVETGDPTICGYMQRYPDGQILTILTPTSNTASFTTDGVDTGVKYMFNTNAGKFRTSIDAAWTHSFKYQILPGSEEVEAAGTFDSQFGNFARWRGLGYFSWSMAGVEAGWRGRYIAGVPVASSLGQGSGRPAAADYIRAGSVFYHDFTVGYTVPGTRTGVLVGVNNAFDRDPPLMYQFVLNGNVNVETYDTVGRMFYVRVSQSF